MYVHDLVFAGILNPVVYTIMHYIISYRLAYSVHMIDMLVANNNNSELVIMYDIACTLEKHLKVYIKFYTLRNIWHNDI